MKAPFAVAIIYRTQRERDAHKWKENQGNCRWTVTVGATRKKKSHTPEKKTQRQFQRHLTRTKDIMALKAKRLNETGKSVFLGIHLHSNYSDILGRARGTHSYDVVQREELLGHLSGLWHEKDRAINMQEEEKSQEGIKSSLKKRGMFSWLHLNSSRFFSPRLPLPPTLRHQVKLQTWGEGMREAEW